MQYQLDLDWTRDAAAEFFCRKIGKRQVPFSELMPITRISVIRNCTFLYLLQGFDTLLLLDEVAVMHPDEIIPELAEYFNEQLEEAKAPPES